MEIFEVFFNEVKFEFNLEGFFSNAVLANNDDVKRKLDALVQSLDCLSTVIDTKCKPCYKKQHLHFTYCYL